MTGLDDLILHAAVQDARRHVTRGRPLREAARLTTPGTWAPFRDRVIEALEGRRQPVGGMSETENG